MPSSRGCRSGWHGPAAKSHRTAHEVASPVRREVYSKLVRIKNGDSVSEHRTVSNPIGSGQRGITRYGLTPRAQLSPQRRLADAECFAHCIAIAVVGGECGADLIGFHIAAALAQRKGGRLCRTWMRFDDF